MYAEVEPFPLHLCKRKCDRKGGGSDGWLLKQDVCKWAFSQDVGCSAMPKRSFSIYSDNTFPSIKLPKQQYRETGCHPVSFLPLLFTGGLVHSSSSFSFFSLAPPTACLYGNEAGDITAKHTARQSFWWNYNPESSSHLPPPPRLAQQRCAVLEGSPFIGLICFKSAIPLKWFCGPHFCVAHFSPLREAWLTKSWVRERWWVCTCLAVGGEATFERPGREARARTIRGDACFPPPPPPPPPSPLWNRSCCVEYFSSTRLE